jgi:DNA helicase-2/ATP-dependent DNA helicase PcrA
MAEVASQILQLHCNAQPKGQTTSPSQSALPSASPESVLVARTRCINARPEKVSSVSPMPWNEDLFGTPLNIAAYPGQQLRVVAGPGTGKTYALMRRVARLLEEGVEPQRILAVSFTRTAATDLVHKLAALGSPGAEDVAAKTLHSLSFGLLSRSSVFEAIGRVPRPLMAHELDTMECDLGPTFGGKRKVQKLVEAFESAWARLQHHEPGWPTTEIDKKFDLELKSWLRFHNAILVGEVIPLALDFITQNPGHPDIPVYEHVLVDEYQDLNRADQALIDAIAGEAAVTVVGDEDQSIYSFRNANPEGIHKYPENHEGTHDELLTECRRCPQRVVALANELINQNRRLDPKTLAPFAQNGAGTIYVVQHRSVEEEIRLNAEYIDWYLQQRPDLPAGEVLVLSSRRLIGNGIRDTLNTIAREKRRTWDAKSFYLEDALNSDAAADGFTLLTLLVDPDDAPALRYWLGEHAQDCRVKPYARVREHCETSVETLREALEKMADGTLKIPYTASLVERFNQLTKRLAELAPLSVPEMIDALFPGGSLDTEAARQAALKVAPSAEGAEDFLAELRGEITQPELPGSAGTSVRIMSLHKSKGLTAKLVVIAGCVSGILPDIDTNDPPAEQTRQLEEQRRLFYVGITRTTDTLVLTSFVCVGIRSARRMNMRVGGNLPVYNVSASMFLKELGPTAPKSIAGEPWRKQVGF